jgi:hypothetical protein
MGVECDENSFVNVNDEEKFLLAPVVGYEFREYQNSLGFKRWDSDLKCNNPYQCLVDKRKVELLETTGQCNQHIVKLVLPTERRVQLSCFKSDISDSAIADFEDLLISCNEITDDADDTANEEKEEILAVDRDFSVVFKSGAVIRVEKASLLIKISGLNPRRYLFKRGGKEISLTQHTGNSESTARLDDVIDAIFVENP